MFKGGERVASSTNMLTFRDHEFMVRPGDRRNIHDEGSGDCSERHGYSHVNQTNWGRGPLPSPFVCKCVDLHVFVCESECW